MSFAIRALVLLGCIWPAFCGAKLRIFVVDSTTNDTVDSCYAEPANFGPVQLLGSFRRPPHSLNGTAVRWAAVINRDLPGRSACYFDTKVLNAQAAGFGLAIIVNYEEALSGMDASDHGNRVQIPAAMVTESCGYLLRQYARHKERFYLTFWLAFPLDFRAYVIPFITIVSVCFLFFTSLWIAKWYRDWRQRQKNRLTRSSLKKLEQKKFDKATDPYECCAICLEDYEQGDKLRILPCNHAYHQACIDPWLLKSRSVCPVCKRRVFPRQPGSDSESSETEDAAATGGGSSAAVSSDERTPLLGGSGSGAEGGSSGGGTFDAPGPSSSGAQQQQQVTVQVSVHHESAPASSRQRGGNHLV
uniref:RING-type domain-containing protein n=1 Tax=Macrostomum lignano TaxID=282301 RepID=A0A1I8HJ18_9PLAT